MTHLKFCEEIVLCSSAFNKCHLSLFTEFLCFHCVSVQLRPNSVIKDPSRHKICPKFLTSSVSSWMLRQPESNFKYQPNPFTLPINYPSQHPWCLFLENCLYKTVFFYIFTFIAHYRVILIKIILIQYQVKTSYDAMQQVYHLSLRLTTVSHIPPRAASTTDLELKTSGIGVFSETRIS